jgi:hypothetical protein
MGWGLGHARPASGEHRAGARVRESGAQDTARGPLEAAGDDAGFERVLSAAVATRRSGLARHLLLLVTPRRRWRGPCALHTVVTTLCETSFSKLVWAFDDCKTHGLNLRRKEEGGILILVCLYVGSYQNS